MKAKKKWRSLLSFLLLSVFLFTGCTPETELPVIETPPAVETEDTSETTETVEDVGEGLEIVETEPDDPESPHEEIITGESPEIVEEHMNSFTAKIEEDGTYTSKDEVAAYLYEYGHLPSNYITKKEAKKLGWVSSEGNLDEVAPGMSIGGDYFGNYEGNLPEAEDRDYYECDIDFDGSYRNSKRIVYSNDGLIYYTEDHYETFELLYGEE